jgi:CheY-like chemotaxis protein
MSALPEHKTILLVEDDPDLRDSITDILTAAGRTVVQAVDGLDALEKLDRLERPCLILLDLLMPRMDGIEFLQRLRRHPEAPEFPVLVLSAHGHAAAREHYAGVLGTLRKPFDVSELLSWIDAHC